MEKLLEEYKVTLEEDGNKNNKQVYAIPTK